jgi:hypothetical protein
VVLSEHQVDEPVRVDTASSLWVLRPRGRQHEPVRIGKEAQLEAPQVRSESRSEVLG